MTVVARIKNLVLKVEEIKNLRIKVNDVRHPGYHEAASIAIDVNPSTTTRNIQQVYLTRGAFFLAGSTSGERWWCCCASTGCCWWCCCCARISVTTWVVILGKIEASVARVDQPKAHARSIGAWTLKCAKEFSTGFDSTFLLPLAVPANKMHLLLISTFCGAAIYHLCCNGSKMT